MDIQIIDKILKTYNDAKGFMRKVFGDHNVMKKIKVFLSDNKHLNFCDGFRTTFPPDTFYEFWKTNIQFDPSDKGAAFYCFNKLLILYVDS